MTRRYRVAFLMQQELGHATYSSGLRRALSADPDIEAVWSPITYERPGGWLERAPGLTSGVKGVLRAALEVRKAIAGQPLDALLFNSPALAITATGWIRRLPTTISLDVTPVQFDREGVHFDHKPDRGPLAAPKQRWNRHIFASCSRLAPWSTWARRSLIDDYGVEPASVTVVPPGIDLEAWAPRAVPRDERTRILFVGGDFQRKGGDLLVDWFRSSRRRHCELHIVSNDPAASAAEGEGIRVHRGLRPDDEALRNLYWSSDMFVLPSRSEPFGIACVEALGAGLPVIATAIGGLTDIVDDGASGLLVPPGDGRALGEAIEALVTSTTHRRAMGEHGLSVARQRFDARRNYGRLLDLIKSSIELKRGPAAALGAIVR